MAAMTAWIGIKWDCPGCASMAEYGSIECLGCVRPVPVQLNLSLAAFPASTVLTSAVFIADDGTGALPASRRKIE